MQFLNIKLRLAKVRSSRIGAILKLVAAVFLYAFSFVRSRWRISNFTICLTGAILGLGAGLFLLRGFVFSPGIPYYSDLVWPYSSHMFPMYYTWDEFTQAPVIINHMLAYMLVYPFSAEASIRLLYLLIFTIMGLSMFFAVFKLTAPRHPSAKVPFLAATLATWFFVLSPVVISHFMHWWLLWFYAFLPLLLYLSYTAFRDIHLLNKSGLIKKALAIALVLFAMSVSPVMPYYFPFLLLAFFAGLSRPFWGYIRKSAVLIGLMLVMYAIFSAIWLVPLALGSASSPNEQAVFSRNIVNSLGSRTSLFESFTISAHTSMHDFWELFKIPEAMVPLWKASLVVIPALAFCSLFFRRSKLIIWLAIFALVFIFLGKGVQPPWGGFYEWFAVDSPIVSSFGWQFRWPHKWLIPLAFCYYMLIGLMISYFLGWSRDRVKWSKIRKALFTFAILVFILAPLYPGYPLLTGDLTGYLRPKMPLNSQWVVEYTQWGETDESDYKMFYYPDRFSWGSPKPAQPSGCRLGTCTVLRGYVLVRDSLPYTTRIGEILSPWNVGYLVVCTSGCGNVDKYVSAIPQQEDIELFKQFGPLEIYTNKANPSQIEVSTGSAVVLGGIDNLVSLVAVDSYDTGQTPLIFLDQLVANSNYIAGADILISSQANLDLYLSLLEENYMIKPFDAVDEDKGTKWSKASAAGKQGGEWPMYMRNAGVQNWQHDYGVGLVWVSGSSLLEMPFDIGESGDYDIFMRCFQSKSGTDGIRISVDGEVAGIVETESQVSEFVWKEVGTFYFHSGRHTVAVDDIRGFQGVNLLAVLPAGELERYEQQAEGMIEDKQVVYLWEAETAMNYSGWVPKSTQPNPEAEVIEYGGAASSGCIVRLADGSRAWRDIDVIRGDEYMVGVWMNGSGEISLDGDATPVSSSELGFEYVGPVHLDQGGHSIEVSAKGGQVDLDVVWLYSVEDGVKEVEDIFKAKDVTAEVVSYEKVNPTKYKVRVNASEPFMLALGEVYSGLWVAAVNGKEYPSLPLNSISNGFWIEDTGDLDITIEFKPQRSFYTGAIISLVGLLGALAFVIWTKRRKKNS